LKDFSDRNTLKELVEELVHILRRTTLKEIGANKLLNEINQEEKELVEIEIPKQLLEEIDKIYEGLNRSAKFSLLLSYGIALHRFEEEVKKFELDFG